MKALRIRNLAAPILVVFCAVLLFLACYHVDNKYTSDTPEAKEGVLAIDEQTLDLSSVLYLISGWEAYPGLLTPSDIHDDPLHSGKSVSIGQYTGFDFGDAGASPHGSATLVLNISLPDEPALYALELPEIFSSYTLYVNGTPLVQLGNPLANAYQASTGNRFITFEAQGSAEVVLAMTDYSHIYSGLVYPPAFGDPDAVQTLLVTRLVIRTVVLALAFALSIVYLILGLRLVSRREAGAGLFVLSGLLCLCFIGYTGYPVFKTIASSGMWWYTLESFCYCAMLLLVMILQLRLSGIMRPAKVVWIGPVVGALVSVAALFTPVIAQGGHALQSVWSDLIGFYRVFSAAFITITAIYALAKNRVHNPVMLSGALIFDVALIMDRILPDFEPILTGWFVEWAGLALVVCTGILMVQDVLNQYRERRALAENLEGMRRLMHTQQAYYPFVLEQIERAREAKHDLRHHLGAVSSLVKKRDLAALETYLEEYQPVPEQSLLVYSEHPTTNMQLSNFSVLAEAEGIRFSARVRIPQTLGVADPDLYAILANLLENAREAVSKLPADERSIDLVINHTAGSLIITVDNPCCGTIEQRGEVLYSQKLPGRPGVGTASVRRLAAHYNGTASFSWEPSSEAHDKAGTFHAGVVLVSMSS